MAAPISAFTALRETFSRHGDRRALVVGRYRWTYADLSAPVAALAARLHSEAADQPLVGFLCNRDQNAYVAVLAILLAGRGYVPLNPKLPAERLRRIVQAAGIGTLIVDPRQEAMAAEVAPDLLRIPVDVAPGEMQATGVEIPAGAPPPDTAAAYLLFTSGSTGEPKGVAVSHGNLAAYLGTVVPLYGYGPEDVHSQTFELTFDLSVHDMMCAFTTGGCLVRLGGAELLAPVAVVRKTGITAWFSVPSLASLMQGQGALKPGAMPDLRVSLFCGEALPASVAADWSAAAPASLVENLYGPTEATIAFTRYRWQSGTSEAVCRLGLVPIGWPFEGQETRVLADAGGTAGRGELLLAGTQVTGAYWRDATNTEARYLVLDGRRWYRTGDLVDTGDDGCLFFLGRLDSQIKYRGHRIELREIENALSAAAGTELVVVLPHPVSGHEIRGLTAVVAGRGDAEAILAGLRRTLPEYMVPQGLCFIDRLPTNLSGKIDRKAVAAWLEAGAVSPPG